MQTQRANLSSTNRSTLSLLLGALLLLAVSSPLLAASGGAQPMIETPQMQQGTSQIQDVLPDTTGTTTDAQAALVTPELSTAQPAISEGALFSANIVFNPCYTFDNPATGCYYKWSPATFCCIGNSRCPDICY